MTLNAPLGWLRRLSLSISTYESPSHSSFVFLAGGIANNSALIEAGKESCVDSRPPMADFFADSSSSSAVIPRAWTV
ncbi:uncharacterized protein LOC143354630 isoform X2 [Halictus rubicundus]|uniref:uncharacterized protein LOC143354630 isoform X2 n=1 Tax=Halictus rubicundus TaxID=77578 RepID=UPI004035C828